MKFDYDLIILGSGPAGFSAAMQASKFDKKVLMVEANENHLGGSWINAGTVPSKALREAAVNIHKFTRQFGNFDEKKAYQRFQMDELLRLKNRVVDHENSEIKRNLVKNEITTLRGYGSIVDAHTVEVNDPIESNRRFTAENILISTGSTAKHPANFVIDHKTVLDITTVLTMEHIPRRLVIVGAGVQAIEYATIFASMGTKITLLNPNEDYFTFLDHEIKEVLQGSLEEFRITLFNNVKVTKVGKNELRNCTEVHFSNDLQEKRVIESEQVLYFGGRRPNTDKIGLENVGISVNDKGHILVDDEYRTSVKSIFAAGDVVGYPELASASFSQGRLATCHMFDIPAAQMGQTMPFSIYSIPEISSVGLTEHEATEAGYQITVGRAYYENLTKATISNSQQGMLKLVFETGTFRLLGVHIIGDAACEIIHIGQAVIALKGDIRYFISHMMNYPTYAEAYRVAAFNGVNRVYKAGVKYKNILDAN
ncbi:MAG: Si-specific NAD(P)(+) transhydrogenase [Bacteroidetes bacterium]|nr:Si-specific NAD(P)(+) transhydrogenase [Bacteroidota bacterium]MCH8523415.1 Si-specific NAD(P)(+) transhydrogenase [Balneolales bacterium]